MPDYDIAILGGGPAGTAAALTLSKRPDLKTVVLEQGSYAAPKVGESLSPGVRSLLQYLNVWERFQREQTLELFGTEAAWGQATLGAMDFIFTLHGTGWALDRQRFETMLADEAARAGATILTDTQVSGCEYQNDTWWIDHEGQTLNAKYLIDAAGRTSAFSIRRGAVRQRNDALVALTARLPARSGGPQMTRVEAVPLGWWYAAPLPSGQVIVCLFSDADQVHQARLSDPTAWRRALEATTHVSQLVDFDEKPLKIEVEPAFSALSSSTPSDVPMIAAGDAIAARDPLSASGIPNAMGGGVQAARVAADHLFGEGHLRAAYLHSIAADHQAYLKTHWKTYGVEQRFKDEPFWRFRQTQVTRPPNTLVRAAQRLDRETSIFVPNKVARWIFAAARQDVTQLHLITHARAEFPAISDERLLLAIEELTVDVQAEQV